MPGITAVVVPNPPAAPADLPATSYPSFTRIQSLDRVAPSAANRQHQSGERRTVTLAGIVSQLAVQLALVDQYYLRRDSSTQAGSAPNTGLTANLPMNGNRITGVGAPVDPTDVLTKGTGVLKAGDTMTGRLLLSSDVLNTGAQAVRGDVALTSAGLNSADLDANGHVIMDLADAVNPQDALPYAQALSVLKPSGAAFLTTPGAWSFTNTTGIARFFLITLYGAGGGGGGGGSDEPGGGGSGGGGHGGGQGGARRFFVWLAIGATISGNIGTGGAAGSGGGYPSAGNAGSAGGSTTCVLGSLTMTASGGVAGAGGTITGGSPAATSGSSIYNVIEHWTTSTPTTADFSGGAAVGVGVVGTPGGFASGGAGGGGGLNGTTNAGSTGGVGGPGIVAIIRF